MSEWTLADKVRAQAIKDAIGVALAARVDSSTGYGEGWDDACCTIIEGLEFLMPAPQSRSRKVTRDG